MTQTYIIYCQASQAQRAQQEQGDKLIGYFLVAAQVDSLIGLDQRIHQHLQKQSWAFVFSHENPRTVMQYLQDKPEHQTAVDRLCAELTPDNPIVLVRLDNDSQSETNILIIKDLDAVEPLDGQFGVHPRKNVPDALQQPLFGQPEPTAADIEHYGGLDQVPPLKTYLVIDAAKIMHGAGIISACGLPYRCLFKGDAAEELKDVAPYLIELDSESDFTRTLFTYNPAFADNHATIHLWHKEPGIYVRSRAPFDAVWQHCRKFTRLQDEQGKWYFFRFWEPRYCLYADEHNAESPFVKLVNATTIDSLLVFTEKRHISARRDTTQKVPDSPLMLRQQDFDIQAKMKISQFIDKVSDNLSEESPELYAITTQDELNELYQVASTNHYTTEAAGYLYIRCSLLARHKNISLADAKTAVDPNTQLAPVKRLQDMWAWLNQTSKAV